MNVFTYGTLMFPEVWQMVVGRTFPTVKASLDCHSVLKIHGAVYPGMVRTDDASIAQGLAYLDVDAAAFKRLDLFEGDTYSRELVTITCADGHERDAYTYLVRDDQRHVLTGNPWTAQEFLVRGGLKQFLARYVGFGRVWNEPS